MILYSWLSDIMHRLAKPITETVSIEWAEDGTSPPGVVALIVDGNAKIRGREFSNLTNDDIILAWSVPADLGGSVSFSVEGIVTDATGPANEGVLFELCGYCIGETAINDAPGAWTTSAKTAWTASQYDRFVTAVSDAVPITDLAAGGLAFLTLRRHSSDAADTYEQPLTVTALKLHYKR